MASRCPIYKCHDCGHFEVIGSEVELEERAVEGWERFEGHATRIVLGSTR